MNIRYLSAAEAEFQEAIDYYNEQRPNLGFEFSDEIKDAVTRVVNYPLAWTPLSKRARRAQVSSFSLQHSLRGASRSDCHRCHSASPP